MRDFRLRDAANPSRVKEKNRGDLVAIRISEKSGTSEPE